MTAAPGDEGALRLPTILEPVEWVPPADDARWVCETCTAVILDSRSRNDRLYCSNACRQKAYRERTGRR